MVSAYLFSLMPIDSGIDSKLVILASMFQFTDSLISFVNNFFIVMISKRVQHNFTMVREKGSGTSSTQHVLGGL